MRRIGAAAMVLLLVSCGSDDSSEPSETTAAPNDDEALELELLPLVGPEYGSAATIGQPVDFAGVIATVEAIEAGPDDELGPSIVVSMTFENATEDPAPAPAPRVQCAVGEVGDRSIPPEGSPFGPVADDPEDDTVPGALAAGESADGSRTIGLPDCGENVPVVIAERLADGDHVVRAHWEVPAEAAGAG